jgi:hypothetical protein
MPVPGVAGEASRRSSADMRATNRAANVASTHSAAHSAAEVSAAHPAAEVNTTTHMAATAHVAATTTAVASPAAATCEGIGGKAGAADRDGGNDDRDFMQCEFLHDSVLSG